MAICFVKVFLLLFCVCISTEALDESCEAKDTRALMVRLQQLWIQTKTLSDRLDSIEHDLVQTTDGGWSEWGRWGSCSDSCGRGLRSRTRTCSDPTPSKFGKQCLGNTEQVSLCNKHPCPDDGPSDCLDLKDEGKTEDGVYNISLWNSSDDIQVYCDMTTAGGGWTVYQNRYDGSVDFYRPFVEYENGFGDLKTEFWLGLKYIQELANQGTTELRIDLEDANGTRAYETFSSFSLSNDTTYMLQVAPTSSFSNNLDDGLSLQYHNGQNFSTYDRDLDQYSDNCAQSYHGAWWYNSCYHSNLNGKYLTPGSKGNFKGILYTGFRGDESLKSSKIMLRREK